MKPSRSAGSADLRGGPQWPAQFCGLKSSCSSVWNTCQRRSQGFRGTVSRILSARGLRQRGENHLSEQPYPKLWFVAEPRNEPLLEFPIWPCTRRGFPCPVDFSPGGGLLHHLFTLTRPLRTGRFVFCGTFRQHALKRASHVYSRRTRDYMAPRPAVFGLSSSLVGSDSPFL